MSFRTFDQGLRFLPEDADLLELRLQFLLGDGSPDATERVVEFARDVLERRPPLPTRAVLLRVLALGLAELGRLDESAAEIVVLGGLPGAAPWPISQLWALHARQAAFLGRDSRADESLDLSLARGSSGVELLYRSDLQPDPSRPAPPQRAATRALLQRAAQRHPRHVDLALALARDEVHQGRLAEGLLRIEQLPAPIPPRLQGQVVSDRSLVLAGLGRLGEGVEVLLAHLDGQPVDLDALSALVGLHVLHGVPVKLRYRQELIPYGPFLSLGAIVALLATEDIVAAYDALALRLAEVLA
jgi:hypothetical protein